MNILFTRKIIPFTLLFVFSFMGLNAQVLHQPQELKKGIYKTVDEFNKNLPSITDSFYVDSLKRTDFVWRGTYSLVPKYYNTGKKVKDIWGFSDGKNAYIYHQFEFFKLEEKNGEWTFVGFELVDKDGEIAAAVMGVLVAGIAGGVASELGYKSDMKRKARTKKIRYSLKESGQIIHPNIHIPFSRFQVGYRINIYRKSNSEIEKPILLLVNENLEYSFIPNSYQSFYFDSTITTVKICNGENIDDCITVVLKNNESNYVQCSFKEKKETLEFFEVYLEKGEYESFKPEKAQKKRELEAFVATDNKDIENKVRVVFYRKSKNEIKEPLQVLLNDSTVFSFVPDSYKAYTFSSYKSAINICCGVDFSKCNTVNFTDGETIYIECSKTQKNEFPNIIRVDTEKGKYDSFKPEKAQKKREKLNQ